MMMAKSLPAHLSYKSTLALLPPAAILAPIDAVRRVHDKHFARWPAHINLIYPFLARPSKANDDKQSDGALRCDIRTRLLGAVRDIEPFHVSLQGDAPGTFHHSRKSKTVWLGPTTQAVQHLQAALQTEFEECNADQRQFTPHLSLGQAHSDRGVQELEEAVKQSISEAHAGLDQDTILTLDWYVDKVYVLEREGFHGRFQIVAAIDLGNNQKSH